MEAQRKAITIGTIVGESLKRLNNRFMQELCVKLEVAFPNNRVVFFDQPLELYLRQRLALYTRWN